MYGIRCITDSLVEWVTDNCHVESWQWTGDTFWMDDRKYAEDIVAGLISDGFVEGTDFERVSS